MTALATQPEPAAEATLPLLALPGLLAGPFLTMLDSSVVNVAVPAIATSLHTGLATVQWAVSGYLLAVGAGLAASAWLTRRFGSRVVYLACLAAFTAASALCALAPNIELLVAFRGLQGLAGAPLTPIAMSMIMGGEGSASRNLRGGAMYAAMLIFLAPAVGPTAGGVLIQAAGWQSIFLVNVPFGILGLVSTLGIAPRFNVDPDPSARFDPRGMALLAAGSVLALYGAGQGPTHGWLDRAAWPFWAIGVAMLAGYVAWAWRSPHPALNLRVLRQGQGAVTMTLATLGSVVSFSTAFLVPVLMQSIQGYTAFQTGLTLLPQGISMAVGGMLGSLVVKRGLVREGVIAGSLLLVATTVGMLSIGVATPAWQTALILCGRGLVFGLIAQPLLMGMMSSMSRAESADASTLFNVLQRLAGSFGIGLLASLFAARVVADGAPGSAFHDVVWALVAISVLGIPLALLLRGGSTGSSVAASGEYAQ